MRKFALTLTFAALLFACSENVKTTNETDTTDQMTTSTTTTQNTEKTQTPKIFELAINKAKDGQLETFNETRAAFVEVLGKEDNTLNEGKWKPFFTVNPDMDLKPVLIGMTAWNSMQGFGESAAKLMPQKEAKAYFASFDPVAYVLLEPIDGKPFDMEQIKEKGTVVEFAIRGAKEDEAFDQPRETFFSSLENYKGYRFSREFKVYELDENSMPKLSEGKQAVIIVWDNAEVFQAAATPIFSSKEYQNFASKIDVSVYFASSPAE